MNSINFIRHGDHKRINKELLFCGLTTRGCDEARKLHTELGLDTAKTVAYSVNNLRSIGTVALALYPELSNDRVENAAQTLIQNGTLRIDNGLDYVREEREEYYTKLEAAFFASNALSFFVHESDDFSNNRLSTYSTMASEIAKRIMTKYTSDNIVVLAREFFYPSFRAKLIEIRDGRRRRDYYASWYGDNMEWNPESRRKVNGVIHAESKKSFVLCDSYGIVEFSNEDLSKIIL